MISRIRRSRLVPTLMLAATIVGLAAGCSDGLRDATRSAPERSASDASCREKNSFTWEMQFRNLTPDPIRLEASTIDCYDWSGRSTPINVFSGESLKVGVLQTFRLEPRTNTDRSWTLSFWVGGTLLSTARFTIPKNAIVNPIVVSSDRRVSWDVQGVPGGRALEDFSFAITRLAPTNLPNTPTAAVKSLIDDERRSDLGSDRIVGVIVIDGYIALASNPMWLHPGGLG